MLRVLWGAAASRTLSITNGVASGANVPHTNVKCDLAEYSNSTGHNSDGSLLDPDIDGVRVIVQSADVS